MVCKNWNPESYFCNVENKTINPDELGECSENCPNYAPDKDAPMITCESCGNEYTFHEESVVEVGSKGYSRCPVCGRANLKADDESLSRGFR
jgi:hypothetical protein